MATEMNRLTDDTRLLRRLYACAITTLADMDAAPTRSEAERLLTKALLHAYADGADWGLTAMEERLKALIVTRGGMPS